MFSLDHIIQIGYDVTSLKYYWAALSTILFYDYFLTLPDEIRYAWKGNKSWAFTVFLLNRYLPMAYAIWIIASNLLWDYTYELCSKTAFFQVFFFIWCTFVAQVVLTIRLYGITLGNKKVVGLFVFVTLPQFLFGVHQAALAIVEPAQQLPPIKLSAYQLCAFTRHLKAEIAYTAISLGYDFLAFLIIVIFAVKAGLTGLKVSRILRTIIQDATVYFLVIFSSHFVFELSILFARPNLQLLPGSGNYVFLPIMIGRLMLSLKRAADPSKTAWSLTTVSRVSNEPTTLELPASGSPRNMQLPPRSDGSIV